MAKILAMKELVLDTPQDIMMSAAGNFRAYRKAQKMTIKELAYRSGVGYSSIKRFESTGNVSMSSLVKMAFVLGVQGELKKLFSDIPPTTIEEFLRG